MGAADHPADHPVRDLVRFNATPAGDSTAEIETLADIGADYDRRSKAEATWKAYRSDWNGFLAWCVAHQVTAMPASPATVALYIADLAREGRKPSTIARRLNGIAAAHRVAGRVSPCDDERVRLRLAGIRRARPAPKTPATPACIEEIRAMVDFLDGIERSSSTDRAMRIRSIRDRAVVLLGFAGALRRSEIAGLDVADLRFVPEGVEVTVRMSKTDQEGEGAVLAIPYGKHLATCPVTATRRWIDVLGESGLVVGALIRSIGPDGYVTGRLSGSGVSEIVAKAALGAGLDPTGHWSGHSLRAGMVTTAAKAGVPAWAIMRTTRHKSGASLDGYIRLASRWDAVASAEIGL
ncbi:MAG: site-specific integrase [Acidimicrobiales bacterium]